MKVFVRVLVAALCSVCLPIVAAGTVSAAPPADCNDLPGPATIIPSNNFSSSTSHESVVVVVGSAPDGTHFVLEGNGEARTFDEFGVFESSVPGPGAPHQYFTVADDGGATSTAVLNQAIPNVSVATSSSLQGPFPPNDMYICVLITNTHTATNLRTTATFTFGTVGDPSSGGPSSGVPGETTSAQAATAVAAAPSVAG